MKWYSVIVCKYRKMSVPVKASFWFVICNVIQKSISMITIPIFTRMLTTSEYGLFTVYQSWYAILGIFTSLNLQDATFNTGMVKYPEDKDNFTLSLQSLTTLLTAVLLLIYLVGRNYWNKLFELPTVLVLTMFVEFLFIPAYSFWSARQKFEYKYVALIFSTLFIAVACPVVAILAIHFSTKKGMARIIAFTLVQAAVGAIFYVLNLHRGKKLIQVHYWKYALTFSLPLIPHYLSMTILQQSDRIMISKLVGSGEAAIYSIAFNISQLVTLVTKAINNSFIPYVYRGIQNKEYKDIKNNSNTLLVLICGMIVGLMLVGPEIIKIFATKEYYDAIWIIPPVALSVFFMFLYPMFSNVEFYFGKSKIAVEAAAIGTISNIVLNFLFIPQYGYTAAGYTTAFCYMIFSVVHFAGMKKVLKQEGILDSIYDTKAILILSCTMSVLALIVLMLYKNTVLRYCVILMLFLTAVIFRNKVFGFIKQIQKKK